MDSTVPIPKEIDDLCWQPVGTLTPATIPSKLPLFLQSIGSKLCVHERTRIRKDNCFLVLQVDKEEAVVGEVGQENFLEEVFEKRKAKTFRLSCGDLIRMIEDEDPTEMDKLLLAEIVKKGNNCIVDRQEDEGSAFFLDLCAYIKDRNLYRTAEGTDKPSQSKDNNASVATE
jgi:hypothetical protein